MLLAWSPAARWPPHTVMCSAMKPCNLGLIFLNNFLYMTFFSGLLNTRKQFVLVFFFQNTHKCIFYMKEQSIGTDLGLWSSIGESSVCRISLPLDFHSILTLLSGLLPNISQYIWYLNVVANGQNIILNILWKRRTSILGFNSTT